MKIRKNFDHELTAELKEAFEQWSFELSPFQKNAITGLLNNNHVLVSAHTGSGKTVPAEFAIRHFVNKNKRVIYTSPIKALTNQKFSDFQKLFPNITFGLLTGDNKFNPDAQVLLMTQEILRNTLFQQKLFASTGILATEDEENVKKQNLLTFDMNIEEELGCVIMDEAHFIIDEHRGIVWEETFMMLPTHIQMCLLTATLAHPERLCKFIEDRGGPEVIICPTKKRVVPLTHYSFITMPESNFKNMKQSDRLVHEKMFNKLIPLKNPDGEFKEKNYHAIQKSLNYIEQKRIRVNKIFVLNQTIKHLKKKDALPAIVFVFSRAKVNMLAGKIQIPLFEKGSKIPSIIEKECENMLRKKLTNYKEYLILPEYRFIINLLQKGIAIHHAGILKEFREMIEQLFCKKYIKVILATETFAMGINMPAKSSVFTGIHKFDGSGFRLIMPWEYIQMAGRAGRRGIDDKGLVILLHNLYTRETIVARDICHMLTGLPRSMTSRFVIHSNLLLRLISVGNFDFKTFIEKSMMSADIEAQKAKAQEIIDDMPSNTGNPTIYYRTDIKTLQKLHILKINRLSMSGKTRKKTMRAIANIEQTNKFIKPDYDKFVKELEEKHEIKRQEKRLENIESFIDDEIKIQIDMLTTEGFIVNDETNSENIKLTTKGEIAVTLQELASLPVAEIINDHILDSLSAMELTAVLSCFTNLHLADDMSVHAIDSINAPTAVKMTIGLIKKAYNKYYDILMSNKLGMVDSFEMHYNMAELAYKWCNADNNESCSAILKEARGYNISLGDFVKAILKINNIVQELEKAAIVQENIKFLEILKQIPNLTLKSCITNQSLYI